MKPQSLFKIDEHSQSLKAVFGLSKVGTVWERLMKVCSKVKKKPCFCTTFTGHLLKKHGFFFTLEQSHECTLNITWDFWVKHTNTFLSHLCQALHLVPLSTHSPVLIIHTCNQTALEQYIYIYIHSLLAESHCLISAEGLLSPGFLPVGLFSLHLLPFSQLSLYLHWQFMHCYCLL